MKIKTKRLENLLKRFKGIVPKTSTRPVLENVLISGENGSLKIGATDAEIMLKAEIYSPDYELPPFLVNFELLSNIIASFSKITFNVDLTIENDNLTVSGDNKSRTIEIETNTEEFPTLPDVEKFDNNLNLCRSDLLELPGMVFCCAKEAARYALNGVCIKRQENFVNAIATDGRRLAITELLHIPGDNFTYILPSKFCALLKSMVQKDDAIYAMSFGENVVNVSWSTDNIKCQAQSRLVEGHYPKYRDVTPAEVIEKPTGQIFFLNKKAHKEFQDNLKFILSATHTEKRGINIILNGKCEFVAENDILGATRLDVNMKYKGVVDYYVDPRYILDGARWLARKECQMNFLDEKRACVLMSTNHKYKYVTMPLRDRSNQ